MQLKTMTLEELKQLRKDVEKEITTFEARRLREAREKLEAHAREMGLTIEDIFFSGTDMKGLKKPRKVNPPKYRHPENPEMTWTGRGRKPAWLNELLKCGGNLEACLIR